MRITTLSNSRIASLDQKATPTTIAAALPVMIAKVTALGYHNSNILDLTDYKALQQERPSPVIHLRPPSYWPQNHHHQVPSPPPTI
jgi:hypothetical protein